jgi:hypothetical protein
MAYAYPKRPSQWQSLGAHHVVLTEPLHEGRLHREVGDALCKPRAKFYGLDSGEGEARRAAGQRFDCQTCQAVAERHGLLTAEDFAPPRVRWNR